MCKYFLLLPLFFLLAACNLPQVSLDPTHTPTVTPTPVLSPTDPSCYFNWASHSLPDLTKQVQAAFESAGFERVTASAEAYGEDCYDSLNNNVVRFAIMETDFRITLEVPDLKDTESLGNQLEKILAVLDGFPTGTTPGPQPGYIGITFTSGSEELHLWFLSELGKSARAQNLHGTRLFEEVQKK